MIIVPYPYSFVLGGAFNHDSLALYAIGGGFTNRVCREVVVLLLY